ncbi:hypothetical protein FNV43_RR16354 [Rhamnella rubrinervis]|uniref:Transcription factor GTE4-like n=1 Tax=Rhamnella rubrinervis TaxID=2594499 RepID=A0A8K0GYM9_9ROSA|nr:hypothetical protein FNV43_RR16354 [Rhamnella rubrinervis]
MASESMLGDEAGEKHRSAQSNKLHARKSYKSKNSNHVGRRPSQTLVTTSDDNNSSQPQDLMQVDDAVGSDDSSNHDNPLPGRSEPASGNGFPAYTEFENRVRISLDSWSKMDIRDLRRKLLSELDQVRCLVKRLESKEVQLSGYSHTQFSANYAVGNVGSTMKVNSDMGSKGQRDSRLFRGLGDSVAENNHGVGESVEQKKKKKTMPMVNRSFQKSEGGGGEKKKFSPQESDKKLKTSGDKRDGLETRLVPGKDKYSTKMFNSCSDLLAKLMKHKFGWVFNVPVDVKGLGLHDYNTVVEHPMDLGTVKTRLNKAWYKSPMEFAEDVRLTFRNAMLYNPKGQDAHFMAEQLLKMFEQKWVAIEVEFNLNSRLDMGKEADLPRPAMTKVQTPILPPHGVPARPSSPPATTIPDRSETLIKPKDTKKPGSSGSGGKMPVLKKPKAKDADKRDMTFEEKQRLSANLQNLPSEKLDNVVQIIKKRNAGLFQHEDEIEVDIANVDPETLWELDRFVTNYRKSLSKTKRKMEVNPIQENV